MSIPRVPESAASPALRLRLRQPKPETPESAVSDATAAAGAGEDTTAADLLSAVVVDPEMGLPGEQEQALAALGNQEGVSSHVRAVAYTVLARSREGHGDDRGAQAALRRAIDLHPDAELLVYLITVTYRLDGLGPALELLMIGRQRWPSDIPLRLLAAELAIDNRELERARELIDAALQTKPDSADALAALARLELIGDQPDAAIDPARRAVWGCPSLARVLLAIALHGANRLHEDPALFEAALADLPSDTWALNRFAQVLLDLNRPGDALKVLDHAVRLHPGYVEVRRTRGYTRAVLHDYEGAMADLDLAAQVQDDGWLTAMRAEVFRLLGNPRRALDLIAAIPDDDLWWVASTRASALLALGELGPARAAYEDALKRHADDVDALCGLAELDLELGDGDGLAEAEHLLRRAVDLQPGNALAQALLAEVLRRDGRLDEAIVGFDEALALSPGYSYALASKGQALIAQGRRKEGIALMIEAVRETPTGTWILDELVKELDGTPYPEAARLLRGVQRDIQDRGADIQPALVHRARFAKRHRQTVEAERLYRRARELSPGDRNLAYAHVTVLTGLGRLEEALAVLDSLPPGSEEPGHLWERLEVMWQLGRLPEVRNELEQLVQRPEPPMLAQAALGEIYRQEGQREQAWQLLNQAFQQDSGHAYTVASLGAFEFQGGELPAARTHLRRALELQPNYPFALNVLIRLELQDGQANAVRELLDRLKDADPGDADLAQIRAMAHYGLGDYSSALGVLDTCIRESGESARLLRARGWVELGLGQSRRATRSFRAAAKLPDIPPALVETVTALLRVDLWTDAYRLATRAGEAGNPHADIALAIVWLRAGAWHEGERYARLGQVRVPQSSTGAHYFARSLRLGGNPAEAAKVAAEALARWPGDEEIQAELGECLTEVGHHDEAMTMFSTLLDRSQRLVSADADDLRKRGRYLLRLGRAQEATHVFLRALSASDQTAAILVNVVIASLLDDDPRQATILVHRVKEELEKLSTPSHRGVLAQALHELAFVEPELSEGSRTQALVLSKDLESRRASLDPKLADLASEALQLK